MGIFDRFSGKFPGKFPGKFAGKLSGNGDPRSPTPSAARERPSACPEDGGLDESAALARLVELGDARGPTLDESLALLASLRRSPAEGRALEIVAERALGKPLPDALVVAAARALVDRGEGAYAETLLARVRSPEARLLRADLAAERGAYAEAVALVEQALVRDITLPGARERHARFRKALGLSADPKPSAPAAETVVTHEPEGPYRLVREVGRGGSAAVYEAVERDLERTVALKVYHHPERDRDALRHEARVAVALRGPNIIRVLDVDFAHGWIALEWAPGLSLRERLRRKDPGIAAIERWALALAAALADVHASGWVHNDVKPANVLFRAGGAEPVLADFGTARRLGDPSPPGSLGYVSPERLGGAPSSPREDVYGLGRVLEDVLDALADEAIRARYDGLVAACIGPHESRPADARAVLTRLRIEAR
jgi:serine/threonine-protein kinase